jgi:hypothetical protein
MAVTLFRGRAQRVGNAHSTVVESHPDKEVNGPPPCVDRRDGCEAHTGKHRRMREFDITVGSVHGFSARYLWPSQPRIVEPDSSEPRGLYDRMEHLVYLPGFYLSDSSNREVP